MGNIRFISDLHLGHKNMALRRGFSSPEEMNEHIITQWNLFVGKHDVVYILGDITMEKKSFYPLLARMKGRKIVILGNHDYKNHVPELLKYVDNVAGMIHHVKSVILTHCPIHPSELVRRFKYNIHGHVHLKSLEDERYINVCCEVIDYAPKLLSELIDVTKLKTIEDEQRE
jgi:calcineurin-like phosphoesterase family protein